MTWILIFIVAGMVFVYLSPDYDMSVVKSESMKPSIEMGDLIITGRPGGFPGYDIRPGTIVSYRIGESIVTHRVLSADPENGIFVTKGDAVEDPDPQPIHISQIVGVYLFGISKLGYLSYFLHTRVGWFLLVILPAAVLVGFIIRAIIKESLSTPKSRSEEG
ncbi:MAG: signal peptidase I [Chloroflexi bacterium]|nr:signal peptidase I [Chloroflexota bacterium]